MDSKVRSLLYFILNFSFLLCHGKNYILQVFSIPNWNIDLDFTNIQAIFIKYLYNEVSNGIFNAFVMVDRNMPRIEPVSLAPAENRVTYLSNFCRHFECTPRKHFSNFLLTILSMELGSVNGFYDYTISSCLSHISSFLSHSGI